MPVERKAAHLLAAHNIEFCEPATVPRKSEYATEKAFQASVEAWLYDQGYFRMTAANMTTAACRAFCRGFYGHWPKARGNPFCADLLVWAWPNVRPPLWLELKTKRRYQPGQREAIADGAWVECWTMADVQTAVRKWEMVTP
jgi:hypothetical protein